MPVTTKFRLKFKKLARKRLKRTIARLNEVRVYDEDHPDMDLLDGPSSAALTTLQTHLEAALLLKILA